MHLVSPFPVSLLGPCFLIWAYYIYIFFFLYFIPYFIQLSRVFNKVLSVRRGFLCFYSYQICQKKESDLNKQLRSRIYNPVIFHTGVFFPFFLQRVYMCLSLPYSVLYPQRIFYFILFYFILYAKSSLCKFCKYYEHFQCKKNNNCLLSNFEVIIGKSVLAAHKRQQRGFCTKYFLLISLVISLVTLSM